MQLKQTLQPALRELVVSARPVATASILLMTDLVALAIATGIAVVGRWLFNGQYPLSLYWQMWPLLGLFALAYSLMGLYQGVSLSPVDELRRTSLATTLIYVVLGTATFLSGSNAYSRAVFLMAWVLSLGAVPLLRAIVRHWCAPRRWWGFPVMVLGAGKTGEMVVETLLSRPDIGLKPVVVLDDDPQKQGQLLGVPVVGGVKLAPGLVQRLHVTYAIVAMPGVDRQQLLPLLEQYGHLFRHVLLIPDLFGFSSLWVVARDLGGVLGLEVRQQLLLPGPKLVKHCLNYVLTVLGGLLVLPLIVACAIAIKLDSAGPIFYGHTRIGREGRKFKAWKFRSMHTNGDRILENYLERYPEMRAMWEGERKLKYDPRVTRVGRWLRRTSLDELPQLWNVLRGEMSLVGPRPIIDEEVVLYGDRIQLYLKVLPGISGLWQVSGRSDTTYAQRVKLDEYYVRNWSVWLDIYILAKTIWVAVLAKGAY
ncbi:undecaprenyl-phosphate galactose phosphotransferase WbaP [Synechococcus sp. PCC 7336]|uniref:undecaprenyl-phosphate galactose phosphotransferase WbaP n=1 Tax=Synechococcus sp. PCC 7336 TaxID=195250 RepID=UPI00034C9820|nr:undecaprenyl-phosphate galactose phosphotransferase WbaP [Synechococcus sp. PCC 7336]